MVWCDTFYLVRNFVTISSEEKIKEKDQESKIFSNYGEYSVVEKLELKLPKTEITIERKSENQFSYYRKNSQGDIANKIIPRTGKDLKIELAPILPLNLPAKKTNDLMFLRLAKPIYVEKNSNIDILVQFPIEIGVYITNTSDNSKDFFDCFTCEPMHSRFALYGTPEVGHLCMYSKVGVVDKSENEPYIYAFMKISISNQLAKGVLIGKFVFPVTNHNIYYKNDDNVAHIDDIKAIIQNGPRSDVIEIEHMDYSNKSDGQLKLSPNTSISSNNNSKFVMERGFD